MGDDTFHPSEIFEISGIDRGTALLPCINYEKNTRGGKVNCAENKIELLADVFGIERKKQQILVEDCSGDDNRTILLRFSDDGVLQEVVIPEDVDVFIEGKSSTATPWTKERDGNKEW